MWLRLRPDIAEFAWRRHRTAFGEWFGVGWLRRCPVVSVYAAPTPHEHADKEEQSSAESPVAQERRQLADWLPAILGPQVVDLLEQPAAGFLRLPDLLFQSQLTVP